MEINNVWVYAIFMAGFGSLVLSRSHVLAMILSLEFLMLGGYLLVVNLVGVLSLDSLVMFLYLFVVVSEASLGLGVLISLVSSFGSEMYSLMGLLLC